MRGARCKRVHFAASPEKVACGQVGLAGSDDWGTVNCQLCLRSKPRPLLADPVDRERLLAQVQRNVRVDERGCWIWTGNRNRGYGSLRHRDTTYLAHRKSYEVFVGPIPSRHQVDHLCQVKLCVNPEHLEAVTQAENNRRSKSPSAINAQKTHCLRGHPFDEANTYYWAEGRGCRTCRNMRNRGVIGAKAAAVRGDTEGANG